MTGPGAWQKSSYSGEGDGNNCLEVKAGSRGVHLRESDTPGAVLTAPRCPRPPPRSAPQECPLLKRASS
ncbi:MULTISPECIES: DUF397 domain-containing protein [unclassified Streptomyces]|uniref:DUF397 domain-containing protein n=1 Tax=unclassified Streptomyces TaxID=2593676 RepID=UPI003809FA8E